MAWGNKTTETQGGSPATLSFIGSEVTITGNIEAKGAMHIDGTVLGDVNCGQVTLGASGKVSGNITSDRANIAGSVEGTVNASDLLIEKSASIIGDLSYDNVSIENGAKVEGRLTKRSAASGELKLVSAINE